MGGLRWRKIWQKQEKSAHIANKFMAIRRTLDAERRQMRRKLCGDGDIMARRKKRKGRRKEKIAIIPMLAPVPGALYTYKGFQAGGIEGAGKNAVHGFTGFNADTGAFEMNGLMQGTIPAAGILVISAVGKKMKLNRYLPRGLPFKLF